MTIWGISGILQLTAMERRETEVREMRREKEEKAGREAGHTPEPWRVETWAGEDSDLGHVYPITGRAPAGSGEPYHVALVAGYGRGFEATLANARRIVACVNACAEIPTEKLEWVPSPEPWVSYGRDELAALREVAAAAERSLEVLPVLMAALDKALSRERRSEMRERLASVCDSVGTALSRLDRLGGGS